MVPCAVSPGVVVGSIDRFTPATAGLRQAEVEELGARLRQHDVAGFQIAMDDARAVRLVERVDNLDGELERLLDRQPLQTRAAHALCEMQGPTVSSAQPRGERLALEQLHHEVIDRLP
ncbi:MAG: hypothetical protein HY657_08250 [Acidobacteria bacterium]|nr:hypothetical protein [Acidobacteriota bacterium]